MASIHLPIRQLVEFLLRTGSIDSRFAGFDRANEGGDFMVPALVL